MKTLASSLLLLTIASFATAADSVALKDIAGDYYFGDGLGVNCSLTVTAKGKFTFQWNGCLGTYDKNEGSASIQDGMLSAHWFFQRGQSLKIFANLSGRPVKGPLLAGTHEWFWSGAPGETLKPWSVHAAIGER